MCSYTVACLIARRCKQERREYTMREQLATPVRSIGVLTGGGDVPGLNAAIKALVYHAEPEHIRVTGLRSGWEGITFLDRSRRKEGRSDISLRESRNVAGPLPHAFYTPEHPQYR